jgi:phage terminase small subunit
MARSYAAADALQLLHYAMVNGPLSDAVKSLPQGVARGRYAVTSERIIRELALIGFGNIDDFVAVQADGSLVVDFGTATREQMASLKWIEVDERMIDGAAAGVRRIKISMSDKRQALMDLAKIARILPADRVEHRAMAAGRSRSTSTSSPSTRSISRRWRLRSATSCARLC